jgi:ABC-2 type transport system ATP-binding protein
MINFIEVGKKYLKKVHSFTINKGSLFAIVGANGSGKTTLIKMLCGLRKYDHGSIKCESHSIAYTPDNQEFPKDLNGYLYLMNLCKIRGLSFDSSLASTFNVPLYQKIDTLSKGNKQKIAIINTLLSDKDIYVFDEPFSALDVTSRHTFIKYLTKYRSLGKTIILSTHNLKYISKIVDGVYEL